MHSALLFCGVTERLPQRFSRAVRGVRVGVPLDRSQRQNRRCGQRHDEPGGPKIDLQITHASPAT